jgi:hypothetical protein
MKKIEDEDIRVGSLLLHLAEKIVWSEKILWYLYVQKVFLFTKTQLHWLLPLALLPSAH